MNNNEIILDTHGCSLYVTDVSFTRSTSGVRSSHPSFVRDIPAELVPTAGSDPEEDKDDNININIERNEMGSENRTRKSGNIIANNETSVGNSNCKSKYAMRQIGAIAQKLLMLTLHFCLEVLMKRSICYASRYITTIRYSCFCTVIMV